MKAAEFDRIPLFIPPSSYEADWCVAGGKGGTKKTVTAFHVAIDNKVTVLWLGAPC
jgi:hypothetical protein